MRPRGAEREALAAAAAALVDERQAAGQTPAGASWREIAKRACVGFTVAEMTVRNMARAGELVAVDQERPGGFKLYAPRRSSNFATATTGDLDLVIRGWQAS